MQNIVITLLAIYAVWSARRIVLLSAALHAVTRMLEYFLAGEI